jgi:hypothetical protein
MVEKHTLSLHVVPVLIGQVVVVMMLPEPVMLEHVFSGFSNLRLSINSSIVTDPDKMETKTTIQYDLGLSR